MCFFCFSCRYVIVADCVRFYIMKVVVILVLTFFCLFFFLRIRSILLLLEFVFFAFAFTLSTLSGAFGLDCN